jgi:sporulation protein YlmC with PRC-barrel domain
VTGFAIGADVHCSDGPCGRLSRLIVEPGTQAVTHLVVEPQHRGTGRLVPVGLAQALAGGVRLSCSRAEFAALEPAEDQGLLPSDSGRPSYDADLATTLGAHGVALSMFRLRDGAQVGTHDVIPLGEVDVRRGEPVFATDGEIGRIQGLVIDSGSHHVTHVLLDEGHLWGRKEVAIPIRAVTRVGDIVRLSISRQQVQDLPPADIDHAAP